MTPTALTPGLPISMATSWFGTTEVSILILKSELLPTRTPFEFFSW